MTTMIQEIKIILEDARQIESATGYGPDCLYHQNRCDSSVRRDKRMAFVKQAEAEFIIGLTCIMCANPKNRN